MQENTPQTHQPNQSAPGRYWLWAIIAVAILLRAGAALYLGDKVVELPGTFDQISYDALAQRVLDGHGFSFGTSWWPATRAGEPTAHWSYLYTLYLVAVYGLAGYHPLVARLIQAALAGLLMPWLVYRLGRRHFSPGVGLVAAALMAVYTYFVYYAATLMTETFYITGILWTLDVAGQLGQAPQLQDSKSKIQPVLLGLALAVTVLLRQVFLVFVPLLFLWLLWRSYRNRAEGADAQPASAGARRYPWLGPVLRMTGALVVAGLILVLSIIPWTVRNYRAFGSLVLLNTNAGYAFFWANHPIHGYNFIAILPASGPSYQALIPEELRPLNEAELDRALLTRGLAFIQEDPVRYLILSASRIKDYFKFWPSADSGMVSNVARVSSFGLFLPVMLVGLWRGRRGAPRAASLLYLFMLAYTLVHLLSWALIRYRLPVDAVLIVFAGVALRDLLAYAGPYLARRGFPLSDARPSLSEGQS